MSRRARSTAVFPVKPMKFVNGETSKACISYIRAKRHTIFFSDETNYRLKFTYIEVLVSPNL